MGSIAAAVPAASTTELVEAVVACAAELAARPAPDHPGECFEQAETLGRVADAIEAALASRVAVADRHGEPQRWGYPSATSWLRTSLRMRHSRADDRAVLARQLGRLPGVAKRLAAEELSFGYASVIAAALRRLDDPEAEKGEQILLELVDAGCSVKEVTAAGDRIKQLIAERDGSEAEPEDGRRGERQWWTMSRTGGGRALSKGVFGPELAALIRSKIEPLAKPTGAEDTRDHAQRMADALQMYLSEGGTAWDPILIIELTQPIWRRRTSPGSAPFHQAGRFCPPDQSGQLPADSLDQTVNDMAGQPSTGGASTPAQTTDPDETTNPDAVIAPSDLSDPGQAITPNAAGGPEHAGWGAAGGPEWDEAGSGTAWEFRPPTPSWPFDGTPFTARLPDGTPIPVQTARRILLTAGFSALVLGTDGQPLYLGRKVRCATPHQRRAINSRYRTCVVAACDIPAGLCELDHADGWANGDVTDVDKLAPLCHFHNTYKYEHPDRIHVTVCDDGRYRYELIRPSTRPWDGPGDRRPGHKPAGQPPKRGP